MIKKIIIYLLPIILFANGIDGTVKDKSSGEPLVHANIFFSGTDFGTVTNEDGYFTINNLPFKDDLPYFG